MGSRSFGLGPVVCRLGDPPILSSSVAGAAHRDVPDELTPLHLRPRPEPGTLGLDTFGLTFNLSIHTHVYAGIYT